MSSESLQDVLDSTDNTVNLLRNLDMDASAIWAQLPDEHTHWIEEQRAWRESCALMDQSYHMADLYLEERGGLRGEDAIELYSDIGVNSFEDFRSGEPPQAKQLVMCNPDGYVIADCILFYLDENEFLTVGTAAAQNWIRYNAETGDYDLSVELADHPLHEGSPADFRFELMGPNSIDIMEEVVDGPRPDIGFFEMDTATINGHEVYLLGHQMSGDRGVELFGSYEHHDEIKGELLEAGEEYEMRQLGSASYKSVAAEIGWIAVPVPAIYDHDELQDYREWLDAHSFEANFAIGGSFVSDDISDYYMTPNALGYEHIVDFDHDFVGKEALEERVENPQRTKVTLVWDAEDVIDVYASLFEGGETNQFFTMPDTFGEYGEITRYDEVRKSGEVVGVSKWPAYHYNHRDVISLCTIDREYSEPGTEVTLAWGEETAKSRIERHAETEITATVAPSPYAQEGRQEL